MTAVIMYCFPMLATAVTEIMTDTLYAVFIFMKNIKETGKHAPNASQKLKLKCTYITGPMNIILKN